jgi:hypothetical protein
MHPGSRCAASQPMHERCRHGGSPNRGPRRRAHAANIVKAGVCCADTYVMTPQAQAQAAQVVREAIARLGKATRWSGGVNRRMTAANGLC